MRVGGVNRSVGRSLAEASQTRPSMSSGIASAPDVAIPTSSEPTMSRTMPENNARMIPNRSSSSPRYNAGSRATSLISRRVSAIDLPALALRRFAEDWQRPAVRNRQTPYDERHQEPGGHRRHTTNAQSVESNICASTEH